jgi:hypothetical protein
MPVGISTDGYACIIDLYGMHVRMYACMDIYRIKLYARVGISADGYVCI